MATNEWGDEIVTSEAVRRFTSRSGVSDMDASERAGQKMATLNLTNEEVSTIARLLDLRAETQWYYARAAKFGARRDVALAEKYEHNALELTELAEKIRKQAHKGSE